MQNAWLVLREEKHVNPRYWVCLELEDALQIASDVATYWQQQYDWATPNMIDTTLYDTIVFNYDVEELYHVWVLSQTIREQGETKQPEGIR